MTQAITVADMSRRQLPSTKIQAAPYSDRNAIDIAPTTPDSAA
jgi:hypothetical protein